MSLPNIPPRIVDNPTCDVVTMRRSFSTLQEEIDIIRNNLNISQALTTLYGKATANWSSATWSVTVNPCDDLAGTNPDTSTADEVYFPITSAGTPNVVVDQIIAYTLGADGTYVCTDLDAPIGRCEWYTRSSANISDGWALMDGSANSVANGGSGIDASSSFILPSATAGGTGGASTHDHTITVNSGGGFSGSVGSNTIGFAITNSALTSITVSDHSSSDITDCISDHSKQEVADCLADHTQADIVQAIGDHSADDVAGALLDHDDHAHPILGSAQVAAGTDHTVPLDADCTDTVAATDCTTVSGNELGHTSSAQDLQHGQAAGGNDVSHGPHATNDPLVHNPVTLTVVNHTVNDSGHTHNLTDPGHTHSLTISSHTHSASASTENHLPPYVGLLLIERIDNSEEVVNP